MITRPVRFIGFTDDFRFDIYLVTPVIDRASEWNSKQSACAFISNSPAVGKPARFRCTINLPEYSFKVLQLASVLQLLSKAKGT